jgi:hypothetical protein
MGRLRRKYRACSTQLVAAEVLETRAVLSAGAAAAHAAVQHAQSSIVQSSQVISPAAKKIFDIDVTTSITGATHFFGAMTVSQISVTPGAHITAHITVELAPKHLLKGTISGKVQGSVVAAQQTTLSLTPGGKLVERSSTLHPPNVYLPSATPTSLSFLNGTQFVQNVNATFHVGAVSVNLIINTE